MRPQRSKVWPQEVVEVAKFKQKKIQVWMFGLENGKIYQRRQNKVSRGNWQCSRKLKLLLIEK